MSERFRTQGRSRTLLHSRRHVGPHHFASLFETLEIVRVTSMVVRHCLGSNNIINSPRLSQCRRRITTNKICAWLLVQRQQVESHEIRYVFSSGLVTTMTCKLQAKERLITCHQSGRQELKHEPHFRRKTSFAFVPLSGQGHTKEPTFF